MDEQLQGCCVAVCEGSRCRAMACKYRRDAGTPFW